MAHEGTAASGTLSGTTITLDRPVPALDGRRVHVVIAPEDNALGLSKRETGDLWNQWLLSGEQGPISEDDQPDCS